METLALLGLVSNLVQFVTFAKELISTSFEIHHSASGISDEILHINNVYGQLSGFSASIKVLSDAGFDSATEIAPAVSVIKQLSLVCASDCSNLLKVTQKLQVNAADKSRWKSFKVALKAIVGQNEMSQMQRRLDATQTTLTLHICTIMRYDGLSAPIYPPFSDVYGANNPLQLLASPMHKRARRPEERKFSASNSTRCPARYFGAVTFAPRTSPASIKVPEQLNDCYGCRCGVPGEGSPRTITLREYNSCRTGNPEKPKFSDSAYPA
jgi:hypothetical protein